MCHCWGVGMASVRRIGLDEQVMHLETHARPMQQEIQRSKPQAQMQLKGLEIP